MKKVDILVILLVLLISITFYISYINIYQLGDNLIAKVTYQNMEIYAIDLRESTNITLEINSKDKILTVNDGKKVKEFKITSDAEIYNKVSITYEEIHMEDANCPNKYCLYMDLRKNLPLPIVCTNGIMVKIETNTIDVVI